MKNNSNSKNEPKNKLSRSPQPKDMNISSFLEMWIFLWLEPTGTYAENESVALCRNGSARSAQ